MSLSRGIIVAVAALAAVACALDTEGMGSPATSFDDAGVAPAPTSQAGDASAPSDARAPDAAAAIDSAPPIDAGDPCDQDHDGHKAIGSCGGDDCCDSDAKAYPGQKQYFETPSACGTFDYDCDGTSSAQFGLVNCQLGWFACSGDGFDTSTTCGAQSTFTSCSWAGVSCNRNDAVKIQSCR